MANMLGLRGLLPQQPQGQKQAVCQHRGSTRSIREGTLLSAPPMSPLFPWDSSVPMRREGYREGAQKAGKLILLIQAG